MKEPSDTNDILHTLRIQLDAVEKELDSMETECDALRYQKEALLTTIALMSENQEAQRA